MEKRLRHFNTDSLLVRGLIPVEAIPVLKTLIFMQLTPKQIYFIWCRFHPDSIPLVIYFFEVLSNDHLKLHRLLTNDNGALIDLGLEDCSPTHLFTDDLIRDVVPGGHNVRSCFNYSFPGLNSLRVWNDGRSGNHSIGDKTIYLFCKWDRKNKNLKDCFRSIKENKAVESLDLSSCNVSLGALCNLVSNWVQRPSGDISISISNNILFDKVSNRDMESIATDAWWSYVEFFFLRNIEFGYAWNLSYTILFFNHP